MENEYPALRAEFLSVFRWEDTPLIHEIFHESKELNRLNVWKAVFLKSYFTEHSKKLAKLPRTARLLKREGVCSAFYSVLEPQSELAPHYGQNKGVIRILFPLVIPDDKERCYIVVGGQRRIFEQGKSLVFDDVFEHHVVNNTDQYRAVLFIDFVRPLPIFFKQVNYFVLKLIANSSFVRQIIEKTEAYEEQEND